MARSNPIGKIKDTAVETISATIKDPVGTAKLAVGQVVGTALTTAAAVTDKVKGTRPAAPKPVTRPEPVALAGDEPVKKSATKKATTKKSTTKKTTKSTAKKSAAKKSPAKKSPAKKSPAKETTTEKAPSPTDGEKTPLTVVDSEKA